MPPAVGEYGLYGLYAWSSAPSGVYGFGVVSVGLSLVFPQQPGRMARRHQQEFPRAGVRPVVPGDPGERVSVAVHRIAGVGRAVAALSPRADRSRVARVVQNPTLR